MKKRIFFVMFFVLSVSLTFGHVIIKYPQGGEEFNAGDTITLQWEELVNHGDSDWDLSYSPDGGRTWYVIVNDVSKDVLEYQWTLPDNPTTEGKIKVVQDNKGAENYYSESGYFTINQVTGVTTEEEKPNSFILYNAYPNPFNNSTVISFSIPQPDHVSVTVYNIIGEEVRKIIDAQMPAGLNQVNWNADNVPSGIYFYTIKTNSDFRTGKVILMK